jgi:hypothetical protein
MADLAIYLLKQTALDLQARPGPTAEESALLEEYTHLPPMHAGEGGGGGMRGGRAAKGAPNF